MRAAIDIANEAAKGFDWLSWALGRPLQIVIAVALAILARLLLHRVIDRIAEGIANGRAGLGRLNDRLPTATAILGSSPLLSARREQRARTTASVLKSATTGVVSAVLLLTVMQTLNVAWAPLAASAGVIGVALGLGAQALIKDVISGFFMIAEDQYGVGDLVDLGEASGTVESVGLRVTRLRDAAGTVWYLRNGEVLRVGNRSQGWARAVLDVGVAPGQDVVRAQKVLLSVAQGMSEEKAFTDVLLEEPTVWGIESVTKDAVVIRLVVKTKSLEQWAVARELRLRILERFEKEGLGTPIGLEAPVNPTW
jgi:small conductance mechanosensitive channel